MPLLSLFGSGGGQCLNSKGTPVRATLGLLCLPDWQSLNDHDADLNMYARATGVYRNGIALVSVRVTGDYT